MTSRIEQLRKHAEKMAGAEHRPDCPHVTAVEPYWPPGGWAEIDENGEWCAHSGLACTGLGWLGPKPPWSPPPCDGCVSDDERRSWRQLAAEAAAYADGDLLEQIGSD